MYIKPQPQYIRPPALPTRSGYTVLDWQCLPHPSSPSWWPPCWACAWCSWCADPRLAQSREYVEHQYECEDFPAKEEGDEAEENHPNHRHLARRQTPHCRNLHALSLHAQLRRESLER